MPLDKPSVVDIFKRIHLFRGIDDAKIEAAADFVEQVEYPAGVYIYEQGDDPDYFFIIAEGQVKTLRGNRAVQQPAQLGLLEEDDYFGEEVLETNWPRQINVETVTSVILLRITVANFIQIISLIPELGKRLQLILDSYRLMLRVDFPWREADETIYFVSRRHVIVLFTMLLAPTLALMIFVPLAAYFYLSTPMLISLVVLILVSVLSLSWWVWNFIDWSNDYYLVTGKRVVDQERVVLLYDSRQESPNEAIQSTTINTTQMGRWVGYGNVAIRTYTGTILFRDVPFPEQVMALVQEQQLHAQYSSHRSEIRDIKTFLEKRIEHGLQRPAMPKPKMPPPKPDPLRQFISTMFHLRYEVGNTVIFRRHWFILLQKTWLPSLILLGLFGLFIASATTQFAALSAQATCGLSLLIGGIVFGWWFYQYMDWHNDLYLITPDQVVDVYKKPLGQEERQAAPIKNILSIEYKRLGFIGLVLNFGTVFIRVGDRELTFDEVYKPSDVQRELFHRLAEVNYNEKKARARDEQQRLGDYFASFQDLEQHKPPKNQPPSQRGGF